MVIIEEVEHLFNPNKTLEDFPSKVEAIFPKNNPITSFHITSDVTLHNVDTDRIHIVCKDGQRLDKYSYQYRNQKGNNMTEKCAVRGILVLSFFAGHYQENAKLITVVHHDRFQSNNLIQNLVPIFTMRQLQSYFVYRLNMITGEHFRVAESKYPEKYTLEHYLIGDGGTIFGFDKKLFLKPGNGKYAMYCTYPTFKQEDHGEDTRFIQGHVLVAATFVGQIPAGYHVHHNDGHPRNNEASNLTILSASDHMKLHSDNFLKENDQKISKRHAASA